MITTAEIKGAGAESLCLDGVIVRPFETIVGTTTSVLSSEPQEFRMFADGNAHGNAGPNQTLAGRNQGTAARLFDKSSGMLSRNHASTPPILGTFFGALQILVWLSNHVIRLRAVFILLHKMLHKSRRVQFSHVVSRCHCSSSSATASCHIVR